MGNTDTSNQIKRDKHEVARAEDGKWLPGQSPNPAGRPKRKTLTELIHAKLDETPGAWDAIVNTVIQKVIKDKEKEIIKTFWAYTDGSPKQSMDIKGDIKITPLTEIDELRKDNSNKEGTESS